jgi:Zn-dependent peptidase ImmA (M78 family)/transcriptional regulator with XRE-family HTH domain
MRLPRRCAVSHATIASYENGTTIPPIDILGALASFYRRPLNWFLEDRDALGGFRYRNLPSRVPLSERRQFEAVVGKWAEAYLKLNRSLPIGRERQSGVVDTSGDVAPEKLATIVRRQYLQLEDDQPIQNMIGVLESFSAWALEVKAPFSNEGAAARLGADFVVVVNPETANERIRLNAAHELAHVIYGSCKTSAEMAADQVEKLAYRFAPSILLPDSQLRAAFKGHSFLRLIQYKERFGVSLVAMIYMAEKSGVISSTASRRLWSEVARRGWRQREPGYVWRDRAIGFEMLLESAITTKAMSWADAERVTGIREPDLRQRLEAALKSDPKPPAGEPEGPFTIKLMEEPEVKDGSSARAKKGKRSL